MADHVSDEYLDELEAERIGQEADRLVRLALEGADPSLDWREAGYSTPEAAARVLLGDSDGTPEWGYAVELLAERLLASEAARLLGRRGGEAGAGRPKRRPSGLTYRPRRREV